MKFRKLACTVLAGAAILGLAACGNSGGSKDAANSGWLPPRPAHASPGRAGRARS